MKIRLDYITNSSSSSYLICTKKLLEDFLKEDLPEIVKYYYNNESDLNVIRSHLLQDNKDIKTRWRAFIIYYHSIKDNKEFIMNLFNNFSKDMKYYLTGEISDKDGQIAEDLDWDRIFDYEKIKEIPELEIFYINHH